ncbi:hypothetical protein SAMN02927937_02822 [Paenimyroides aquimaris]|uniref:Uncharacterized protein n=2 Tax=Paenimyroides marinum TaxID=1159016 RepID=A0A1H6MXW2_9FLAO|nr:hypothetical protein SAMN02927937_02822 [Paenimyroides aquimaris]
MQTLLKMIKCLLIALTILLVCYILGISFNHDTVFYLNEKYSIYIIIQLIHLAVSLSSLFVIWSSNLYNRWKKTDQTLLVVFLSVFGLWYWYVKYHKTYLNDDSTKE